MKFFKITISFPANCFFFGIHGYGVDIENKMIMCPQLFKDFDREKKSIMVNKG
jgi:hypothetical protein